MADIFYDETYARSERVYALRKLTKNNVNYLTNSGFKRVRKKDFTKKTKTYLVKTYEKESARHMIMIYEAANFIKRFAQEVKTFRSVRPDIVFKLNGKNYAIEVETGITYKKNKKILREKVRLLNQEFKDRWFFLVTDRNFKTKYEEFGKTLDKRNFKSKLFSLIINAKE